MSCWLVALRKAWKGDRYRNYRVGMEGTLKSRRAERGEQQLQPHPSYFQYNLLHNRSCMYIFLSSIDFK